MGQELLLAATPQATPEDGLGGLDVSDALDESMCRSLREVEMTCGDAEDQLGRPADLHVRAYCGSVTDFHPSVIADSVDRLAVDLQFAPRMFPGLQEGVKRRNQPPWRERVVPTAGEHQRFAPTDEAANHRAQPLASTREVITLVDLAHEAVSFEPTEPVGKKIRRHTRQTRPISLYPLAPAT